MHQIGPKYIKQIWEFKKIDKYAKVINSIIIFSQDLNRENMCERITN